MAEETLTLEQLRAKAVEALGPEPQETEKVEPSRDDKGRFVKTEPEKPEAPETEEVDEVVYERVIDLGDGSGVQVFRGSTLEDLIDKLAVAQENATRKIRELSATQKTAVKVVEEAKGLTDDERFILSQKILTEPDKVIERFIEETFNKKFAPKLEKVEEFTRAQREQRASEDFVQNTPEYYAIPRNGQRMVKYMEKMGMEANPENLQAAFEDLNASGLLEVRPTEKQDAENDVEEAKPERIAPKVETVVKRKVVGGLSTKRQAPVVTKSPEPTEKDFEKMSQDQLRELALKSIWEQN